MLGIIMAVQDDGRMPEAPDDPDPQGGREELPPLEFLHQEAAPGNLFTESKDSIDGDSVQEPADHRNGNDAPDTESFRHGGNGRLHHLAIRRPLGSGHQKRHSQDSKCNDGHQQPAYPPPAVELEGYAQVLEYRFLEDQLRKDNGE